MVKQVTAKEMYERSDLERLIPGDIVQVNKGWSAPQIAVYNSRPDEHTFEFIWPRSYGEGIVGLRVANPSFNNGVIIIEPHLNIIPYLPDDSKYKAMESLLQQAGLI